MLFDRSLTKQGLPAGWSQSIAAALSGRGATATATGTPPDGLIVTSTGSANPASGIVIAESMAAYTASEHQYQLEAPDLPTPGAFAVKRPAATLALSAPLLLALPPPPPPPCTGRDQGGGMHMLAELPVPH